MSHPIVVGQVNRLLDDMTKLATEGAQPVKKKGWPELMYDAALNAGYDFQPGEIGRWCKPVVDRFGAAEVLRTWSYWCANAALHAEGPQYINPRWFARRYGYWRHLASDA